MTGAEIISSSEARRVALAVLERAGVPAEAAVVQADLLIEADLRGRPSHGLLRLPRIVERIANELIAPATRGVSQWKRDALLDVDGMRGLGPVVAFAALEQISERARSTGVASAVIRNSNHIGMLALYAERFAEQGQVVIALSTSEALVHPWGGRRALLGTNPIAIGVPADPEPFVMDMATGLISMGQVHDYAHRNLPLQPGWALDAAGETTTDAMAAKSGAIAPFGQAKGYALGLAFEVLVGSLTACSLGTEVRGTLDSTHACNKGDVFVVLEPASTGVVGAVSAYLDEIRNCAPVDPRSPVVVPGDGARRRRARNLEQGISLPRDVWERLQALA